jgi:Na+/H+ antiporter NhaD/arsenite permease-like protein
MRKEQLQRFPPECMPEMISGAVITLGMYLVFWRRKNTKVINQLLPDHAIHADRWFYTCLCLDIASIAISFTNVDHLHPVIGHFQAFMKYLSWLLRLVWNFRIRNRINLIFEAERKTLSWFSSLWVCIFGAFYLQYKLNYLKKKEGLDVHPDSGHTKRIFGEVKN